MSSYVQTTGKANGEGKEPAGFKGDDSETPGQENGVRASTPENKKDHLNPSAPEDANVTPGSAGEK
jgi:hypothetical protein